MLIFRCRHALIALTVVAAVTVVSVPAQAQDIEPINCLGLNTATAAAQGYQVQIGTEGSDVIVGGNTTKDLIIGLGGDDVLTGAGQNDVICGGSGDDIIFTGDGNDRATGGLGDDELTLGAGDDVGFGRGGKDRLIGGTGDDRLIGGRGADRISGEAGDDRIVAGGGPDVVFGGLGHDRVSAGTGDDRVSGGPGRDILHGGRGGDIISGDEGRDRLIGGGGDDVLDGDGNYDRIRGGEGTDRCDPVDSDLLRQCETDLGGDALAPGAGGPPPDPNPPAGGPVPAEQAPQGTNQFGWPLLTDTGLAALMQCESGGNHAANTGNRFYGGVQWLPATWNAAARGSGHTQYEGTLPHLVPAEVQDAVAKWWWEATRPNTQWPHCHVVAMAAMNVLAP